MFFVSIAVGVHLIRTNNPVIKASNNPVGEHDDMWV